MNHPIWLLLPWTVFAIAASIKLWQITALLRRRSINRLRAALERQWNNSNSASPQLPTSRQE